MATQQNFDGLIEIIPGVFANVKSGVKNPPVPTAYGNLLVIDTGSGAGAGGGSGINGTIQNKNLAIYDFDNEPDFLDFVEKGLWFLLADPLFTPLTESGVVSQGVSKITYIKAATTTPALMEFLVGGESSDSVGAAGSIEMQVRSEGLVGNGALNVNNVLSRGYGFILTQGVIDNTKYIMNFYRGTFRGLDQNGNPIGNITEANSVAQLLTKSVEFNTVSALVAWMQTDATFNKYFRLNSYTIPVHDNVDKGDFDVYNSSLTLASGGTEVYGAQDFQDALTAATKLNVDFVFSDKYGANSRHANNSSLETFVVTSSKFKPQLYIASQTNQPDFATSIADAKFFNSQQVTVVHGGSKISISNNRGFNVYDSYYSAAILLGREAGLQPQVPLTFKDVSVDGLTHVLNETEEKQALNAGLLVLVPNDDGNGFECLKGVNTLQENTFLQNDDGTTHSKQFYRIARQLNKMLIIDGKKLLKDPKGVNRNTLSSTDLVQFTKRELLSVQASPGNDGLILGGFDGTIVVTRKSDAWFTTYSFIPNTEISFLFFTGFALDVN